MVNVLVHCNDDDDDDDSGEFPILQLDHRGCANNIAIRFFFIPL